MTKKPATPAPASLPATEVQALADVALSAWDSGTLTEAFDSHGDHWVFEPIRDEHSRLLIQRFNPADPDSQIEGEKLAAGTHIATFEFGLEHTRVLVTSRVQAVATPA